MQDFIKNLRNKFQNTTTYSSTGLMSRGGPRIADNVMSSINYSPKPTNAPRVSAMSPGLKPFTAPIQTPAPTAQPTPQPMAAPQPAPQSPKDTFIQGISDNGLKAALYELESGSGSNYSDYPDRRRTYTTVPANDNEKPRSVDYTVAHAGAFGLTYKGLGELAKSEIDKTSAQNSKGYTGFKQKYTDRQIQDMLMNGTTTAGDLAVDYFRRKAKLGGTPEELAQDYVNNYVTDASPHHNQKNIDRAKKVFMDNYYK